MSIELRVLGWSVVLGFIHVFSAAAIATYERGLKWNAGNRDGKAAPLSGFAARAARASGNFLETFPFFAAALLAVVVAQKTTDHTALGAETYLAARVAYLPIYLIGIPYVRTLIFGISVWGIVQLIEPLLV